MTFLPEKVTVLAVTSRALPNEILESLALHVLKNDIGNAVVLAHAVSPDDVVVGQLQAGPSLPIEAAQEFLIVQILLLEHLHGHHLAGGHVDGPIHAGHAAAADLADDSVLAVDDIRDHSSTPPSLRTRTREMLSELPRS